MRGNLSSFLNLPLPGPVSLSVGVSLCPQRSVVIRFGFPVHVVKLRTLRSVLEAVGGGAGVQHTWEDCQPVSPTVGSADPKLIYLLLVAQPWVHWPALVLKCSLFSDVR